jgi:hypothetical protein
MNGAVVRAGAEVGVLTPVNARLAALVDAAALDPERRAWFRHNPERLVDAVTAAAAATTSLH